MEKRNTLLLTVIAVATLLVAVVGATFAYFASTDNYTATLNMTATTQENASAFIATGGNFKMDVLSGDMLENDAAEGNVAASANGDLTVTFTSGTTAKIACTYDVYFAWDEGSTKYTAHSAGVDKLTNKNEFTLKVAATHKIGTDGACANCTNGTTGTIAYGTETDFVDAVGTNNKAVLLTGATIYSESEAVTTTVWNFETKFYNLPVDQSALSGETYTGKFGVENVVCKQQTQQAA